MVKRWDFGRRKGGCADRGDLGVGVEDAPGEGVWGFDRLGMGCQGLVFSSQFRNNCSAEMWSGSEEGSYLRPIDCCITHL
jgi:hypothetical protein